jgi:hypothetical protein
MTITSEVLGVGTPEGGGVEGNCSVALGFDNVWFVHWKIPFGFYLLSPA